MMAVLKNLFRFRLPQNISDVISSKPLPGPGDAAQKFLCLLGIILFVVLILQTVVAHPALFLIILLAEIRSESTRLNSSHVAISYAVFCLKKKKKNKERQLVRNNGITISRERTSDR